MAFEQLTEFMDKLERDYDVPGADIIVKQGHKTLYRYSVGHRDNERKDPVREDDIYIFYSATKVITMTAVMQLIEQGKVGLYDPVAKYLPEYANMRVINREFPVGDWMAKMPEIDEPAHFAKTQIRIIDLMAMMSGMTYDLYSKAIRDELEATNGQADTRALVRAMAKMPLIFDPGTRWSYGLSHDVLAAVVEVVSGMKFGDYLKKHIFDPLEANDLYFALENDERMAAQFRYNCETNQMEPVPKTNEYRLSVNYESGGAGLMGTVESYSKVMEALSCGGVGGTGNRILSEESVQMFMNSVTIDQPKKDFSVCFGRKSYEYGLGVRVKVDMENGLSPVGEFGWDGAAGAFALVDTKNQISVFYAQHILGFATAYSEIHPKLRDLVYEALELA